MLRGANSFINGAAPGGGGVGGSINLLPKRASNNPLTQATVGVESGDQGYGAVDISRRFGENGNTGILVNAVRRDGDTAIDGEKRELTVASIGADFQTRDFRLSADIGSQNHKLKGARPSVTVNTAVALPSAPDSDSNWAQKWPHSNERATGSSLTFGHNPSCNLPWPFASSSNMIWADTLHRNLCGSMRRIAKPVYECQT